MGANVWLDEAIGNLTNQTFQNSNEPNLLFVFIFLISKAKSKIWRWSITLPNFQKLTNANCFILACWHQYFIPALHNHQLPH